MSDDLMLGGKNFEPCAKCSPDYYRTIQELTNGLIDYESTRNDRLLRVRFDLLQEIEAYKALMSVYSYVAADEKVLNTALNEGLEASRRRVRAAILDYTRVSNAFLEANDGG